MIRGAVREAGDRAKVAVYSRERDVDPVGACVGMKGTRVQSIIRELRGEKIDIVEWSEDPVLVRHQRASARPRSSASRSSTTRERVMEVVVEDRQLSLAIGKKGQNVRLAAKLTGWKIDIKSEEEKRREVEAQFGALEIGEPTADGEAERRGRSRRGAARRRSRREAEPVESAAAGTVEAVGRARPRDRRRPRGRATTDEPASRTTATEASRRAPSSRSIENRLRELYWQQSGFTKSRSCSTSSQDVMALLKQDTASR